MTSKLQEKIAARLTFPTPERCREIREAAHLSLADIAQEVPCTPQAVYLWETGQRTPRGPMLVAYLRVLHEVQSLTAGAAGGDVA